MGLAEDSQAEMSSQGKTAARILDDSLALFVKIQGLLSRERKGQYFCFCG